MAVYLDAMGGDNAPDSNIHGALAAAPSMKSDIVLVGDQDTIVSSLKKAGAKPDRFGIVHTTQVIGMDEEPAIALKAKKDSSIAVGAGLAKQPDSAFVSAGSTGAVLSGALLVTGRIKGIARPAMGVVLPGAKPVLLIDTGANADCKPEYFVQFASMGAIYMKALYGLGEAKVGLVNIGTEEKKGSDLYKTVHALLKESTEGFAGNVEPKELLNGVVDVAVCDGFTGNIVLKTLEGTLLFFYGKLKGALMSSTKAKLGALALKGELGKLKESFNPNGAGGAPFLGVNGIVIKAHGSSDSEAIGLALMQADRLIETRVLESIAGAVEENSKKKNETIDITE